VARPKLSRTIDAILANRGIARLKDALTGAPSDSEAASPSSNTIATDTVKANDPIKAPTTSAVLTNTISSETTGRTPLNEFHVSTLLLGPRPLPEFNFDSPGGTFLVQRAAEIGISPADLLEHMVAWGYRIGANVGNFSLEELALFYKDNKPEWWFG